VGNFVAVNIVGLVGLVYQRERLHFLHTTGSRVQVSLFNLDVNYEASEDSTTGRSVIIGKDRKPTAANSTEE
jgi:hypothetical protein